MVFFQNHLEVCQRQACFNSDREVVDSVIKDAIETTHADWL